MCIRDSLRGEHDKREVELRRQRERETMERKREKAMADEDVYKRQSLGSTGITIVQSQGDREKERGKGRHTEALNTNLQLDNIQSGLQAIFRK